MQDWLKIWCWWYSSFKFFFLMNVFLAFFRQRNTAGQRCGIATNTTVSPRDTLQEEIIISIKLFSVCNFFKNDVIYLWLLFCLFFILISQSCENMLYDIVCLFYFRNHNFTLIIFCRIPVDFFVDLYIRIAFVFKNKKGNG